MKQVHERVFVGSDADCRVAQRAEISIVHGCKTCHQAELKYTGALPVAHPKYLSVERDNNLFLNIVDPPIPLFRMESFEHFLKFASERYAGGESLLVHCNQGRSRAPSLALLFLAKKLGVIGNGSFNVARSDFQHLYPSYAPGQGIERFLKEHWKEL